MGIEQFKPKKGPGVAKPARVNAARVTGNTEKLRAFGRRGAEVTNEKRAQARIEDEMLNVKRAEEAYERAREAHEDLAPLD
jgi:hypothetical protein